MWPVSHTVCVQVTYISTWCVRVSHISLLCVCVTRIRTLCVCVLYISILCVYMWHISLYYMWRYHRSMCVYVACISIRVCVYVYCTLPYECVCARTCPCVCSVSCASTEAPWNDVSGLSGSSSIVPHVRQKLFFSAVGLACGLPVCKHLIFVEGKINIFS